MRGRDSRFEKDKELHDLAESQGGFFTTSQAEKLGFLRQHHSHEEGVRWEKISRGIYRHKLLNISENKEELHILRLHFLKKDGSEGIVFSGETAASVQGIGDFLPQKVFALMEDKRRLKATPPLDIEIKRVASLAKFESRTRDNLPVTTPAQTLIDLLTIYDTDPEEVRRAFTQARNDGKLTSGEVRETLSRPVAESVQRLFKEWEASI
ncbi:MAG: hypothetical protein EOP04_01935 [Proteobacteria bacterium]|nr:MAG: hypothetical protein EOP04_01935 [Pseudomonadota bacterium]